MLRTSLGNGYGTCLVRCCNKTTYLYLWCRALRDAYDLRWNYVHNVEEEGITETDTSKSVQSAQMVCICV